MLREILEMIAHHRKDIDNGLTEFIDKIYSREISQNYHKSYIALKKVTKDFFEFPTKESWDKYAKDNNYLSHVSLEFIVNLKWKKIKKLVESEIEKDSKNIKEIT